MRGDAAVDHRADANAAAASRLDVQAVRAGREHRIAVAAGKAHRDAVVAGPGDGYARAAHRGDDQAVAGRQAVAQHQGRVVRGAERALDAQRVVDARPGLPQVVVAVVADERTGPVPEAGGELDVGDVDLAILVGVAGRIIDARGDAGAGHEDPQRSGVEGRRCAWHGGQEEEQNRQQQGRRFELHGYLFRLLLNERAAVIRSGGGRSLDHETTKGAILAHAKAQRPPRKAWRSRSFSHTSPGRTRKSHAKAQRPQRKAWRFRSF